MRKPKASARCDQCHYAVFFKTYKGVGANKRMNGQYTGHVSMPTPLEYFNQFKELGDAVAKSMGAESVFICSATPIMGPTRPSESHLGAINNPNGSATYQYRVYFLAFHRLEDGEVALNDCSINIWLDQQIDYYSDVNAVTEFCATQAKANWAVVASWTSIKGYDRSETTSGTTTLSINVSGVRAMSLS